MNQTVQAARDNVVLAAQLHRDRPPALEGEGSCSVAEASDAQLQRVCMPPHPVRSRPPAGKWLAQEVSPVGDLCGRCGLLGRLERSTPVTPCETV